MYALARFASNLVVPSGMCHSIYWVPNIFRAIFGVLDYVYCLIPRRSFDCRAYLLAASIQ